MPDQSTTTLALAVWPPAPRRQPGRYLAASKGKHPIAPELAARAILAYSDPGDLVVDPACGIGTVLVEAIHTGRRAIGIAPDRRQAALASANVSHARQQGAPGRAGVLEGNPDQLPRLLAKAAATLNPPPAAGRLKRHPAGSAQLILTIAPALLTEALLLTWAGVIAPGGFLLLVRPRAAGGRDAGLGLVVAAAERSGLEYWQHVIALRTGDGGELHHLSVLAFRKPDTTPHVAAVRPRVPARRAAAA
jgi:SAM-dependent methyltransferase